MRFAAAGLILVLVPATADAQDPGLETVDTRIQEGRIGEARASLERWWQVHRSDAKPADIERSLWLRARLTVDPSLAEIDYQRLVLEFPSGPYAADARLRLAQSAQARGDLATALEQYEAIVRHHVKSHHRRIALEWLRRNGERVRSAQVRGSPVSEEETTARTVYALQLGAFERRDRADALVERARAAGLAPRIVQVEGDQLGLIRVRIGRFSTPEAAGSTRLRLVGLGFVVTIVPDGGIEVDASGSGKNGQAPGSR